MSSADQDKRPMFLAIAGTITALIILVAVFHKNNEPSEVPEQAQAANATSDNPEAPAIQH